MILLLLSCQAEKEEVLGGPFVLYEDAEEFELDLEELEARLQRGLSELRFQSSAPFIERYQEAMMQMSGSCPTWYNGQDGPYWSDECVSDSGMQFSGVGTHVELNGVVDPDENILSGHQVYGLGELTYPNGDVLRLSGFTSLIEGVNRDGHQIFSQFHESGFELSTATEELTVAELSQWAMATEAGGRVLYSDGVILSEEGAIALEGLMVANSEIGTACPGEYGGGLSYFNEEHGWLDVRFDGPTNDNFAAESDACDGCGLLFVRGIPQGEICLDPTEQLLWEERPF